MEADSVERQEGHRPPLAQEAQVTPSLLQHAARSHGGRSLHFLPLPFSIVRKEGDGTVHRPRSDGFHIEAESSWGPGRHPDAIPDSYHRESRETE